MQAIIDFLDTGGTWTWISAGAGILAWGFLVAAFFTAYRQRPATTAAELGLVALLTAGWAWWQATEQGQVALAATRGSQTEGEFAAAVAARRAAPFRVGLLGGVGPLVLGLLIASVGPRTPRPRRRDG